MAFATPVSPPTWINQVDECPHVAMHFKINSDLVSKSCGLEFS